MILVSLHFHHDQETLLAVVCVLVDVLDVDDVFTATRFPVKVYLSPGFETVFKNLFISGIIYFRNYLFQNLQGTFLLRLQVLALDHLTADAKAEHVVYTVSGGLMVKL